MFELMNDIPKSSEELHNIYESAIRTALQKFDGHPQLASSKNRQKYRDKLQKECLEYYEFQQKRNAEVRILDIHVYESADRDEFYITSCVQDTPVATKLERTIAKMNGKLVRPILGLVTRLHDFVQIEMDYDQGQVHINPEEGYSFEVTRRTLEEISIFSLRPQQKFSSLTAEAVALKFRICAERGGVNIVERKEYYYYTWKHSDGKEKSSKRNYSGSTQITAQNVYQHSKNIQVTSKDGRTNIGPPHK